MMGDSATWQQTKSLGDKNIEELDLADWQKHFSFSTEFIQLLWQRGFTEISLAEDFLSENTSEVYSYYKQLTGAESAAARILKAIKNKDKVIIYGDYDVDGITSTSLLWRFLYRELGANVIPFVPHREREGYGLNEKTVTELLEKYGAKLLITVDCGVRDGELIEKLKEKNKNLEVIVTDHHQLPEDGADFEYLVHPFDKFDPKEICACAVVWGLICELAEQTGIIPPKYGLDLVALATVCDIMPLTGLNRKLVKVGLKEMEATQIAGLEGLLSVADLTAKKLSAYHLGFVIGPRINAAGRIGEPIDAVKMLTTDNNSAALKLAHKIDELNKQRQQYTAEALDSVPEIIPGDKLLFVSDPAWKEGVIGLIAGKLQERYNLPAIAVTQTGLTGENTDAHWVGSARSNKHLNITDLLAEHSEILIKFGGHAAAAGFSVDNDKLKQLSESLKERAAESLEGIDLATPVYYDLALTLNEFPKQLLDELTLMEPFGYGNKTPQVRISGFNVFGQRMLGRSGKHIALQVDRKINPSNLELVWFNHNFRDGAGQSIHDVVGALGYNEWQGRKTLQLKIKHHSIHA